MTIHQCTLCSRRFYKVKCLNKHWDDCKETPAPLRIDPSQNAWLNDCEELLSNHTHEITHTGENEHIHAHENTHTGENEHNHAHENTHTGENEHNHASENTHIYENEQIHTGEMTHAGNELLLTLCSIVEVLAEQFLKPHHNPITFTPPEPLWHTVPGVPRKQQTFSPPALSYNNRFAPLSDFDINTIPSDERSIQQSTQPELNSWSPTDTPTTSPRKNFRPQVVINHEPENDNPHWRRTVPGNNTFAGAVQNGRKIALFSDSICNRMNYAELNRKLRCRITKKTFPGATTHDLSEFYMLPTLKNNTPDTVIIHIGANDLLNKGTRDGGATSNVIDDISNDIIKCGKVCAAHGVNNICISSVLPFRGRLTNSTINYINDKLAKLCRENSFDFLLNDNIIYDHSKSLYYHDGIHLNEAGRDILMDNFSTYLNPN